MVQAAAHKPSTAGLAAYLAGVSFPAEKGSIIEHATQQGAPSKVIGLISKAPDKTYGNARDLMLGLILRRDQISRN